jgi:hypothetical protein
MALRKCDRADKARTWDDIFASSNERSDEHCFYGLQIPGPRRPRQSLCFEAIYTNGVLSMQCIWCAMNARSALARTGPALQALCPWLVRCVIIG